MKYHGSPITHTLFEEYVTIYKVIKKLILTPTLFTPYELRIFHDFENFFLFMLVKIFKVQPPYVKNDSTCLNIMILFTPNLEISSG